MAHLHAYVHDDVADRLREHAAANDRSLAGELRRALRMYCDMLDRRTIAPPATAVDDLNGGRAGLDPPLTVPPS